MVLSTLEKSWTSKGLNHEVSQHPYSNHTPFNQGTMYILMKGLKVPCPVPLIVHAQNKIWTYYVGKKKMISLQKGSGKLEFWVREDGKLSMKKSHFTMKK